MRDARANADGGPFTYPLASDFRADKSRPVLAQRLGVTKLVLLLSVAGAYLATCWVGYGRAAGHAELGARATRLALCAAFGAIFVARVLVQMLLFWRRRIVPFEVYAECLALIPGSLFSLAWAAATSSAPLGAADYASVPVFALGTLVNVWSEGARDLWKRAPANRDRPYTRGWFALSRHVNYFAECASFSGFGLACGRPLLGQWVALAMAFGMVRTSIPEIAGYLAMRYGERWSAYLKATPHRFVPFLY